MSEGGLTPKNTRQQHSARIADSTTFKTHGLDEQAAVRYLSTEEGKAFFNRLTEADPDAPLERIKDRAIIQLTSGRELPRIEMIDEPLVKIVPRSTTASPYSPFFAKQSEFVDAVARGHQLNDRFGLPIASEAPVYDI
ncbi:MAG: hypothetical protein Q4G62_09755 [Pseudomonadota bacterium]|nr:hypothetical protein [Pseudomonadota bacterium]